MPGDFAQKFAPNPRRVIGETTGGLDKRTFTDDDIFKEIGRKFGFAFLDGNRVDGDTGLSELLMQHPDVANINVRINSPGGDVFDGVAIYNSLLAHKANVTTIVDGLAASAASLILQAGDNRQVRDSTQVMIHRAWTWAMGNSGELSAVSDILTQIDTGLVNLYAERSGQSAETIEQLLVGDGESDGTWFDPEQAIEQGLADEVSESPKAKAKAKKRIDFSQLGELRVAAMFSPLNAESEEEDTAEDSEEDTDDTELAQDNPEDESEGEANEEAEETSESEGDEGSSDEPAATFEQLSTLAGDDSDFIVKQLSAKASLAAATTAYIASLKSSKAEADEKSKATAKELADVKGAAGSVETDAVSTDTSGDEGGGKKGKLKDRIKISGKTKPR